MTNSDGQTPEIAAADAAGDTAVQHSSESNGRPIESEAGVLEDQKCFRESGAKESRVISSANGEAKRGMLPPPIRQPPPVPKFNSPAPGSASKSSEAKASEDAAKKARAVASASASRAGLNATPGQREKAIAAAAAAAAADAYAAAKNSNRGSEASTSLPAAVKGDSSAGASPSRPSPAYSEPSWAGGPSRSDFFLETMKGGQIIVETPLTGKSHFTFGRMAACDLVLEHPSISRLHAVLQFGAEGGAPSLYDCGSVHGTFLNKGRLKPKIYAPLSVGDMMKFGQSSRTFILGGPGDLMPEEGLSRAERRQLATLEAKERRKLREEEVAKAQMAAALNRGISWGMGEDAADDDDDDEDGRPSSVEWRSYAQTHSLTDNQQKLAEKLRRLENRIRNLTTEAERIRAKQGSLEDLSAGQATQLARNEQIIDKATEDFGDLEELLNDSIAESLRGKRSKLEAQESKKRRKQDVGEEEEGSGSEEDDFYDRTEPGKAKKRKAAPIVHDAASLFGRKEALLEEKKKLASLLAAELLQESREPGSRQAEAEKVAEGDAEGEPPPNPAAADPLDAFMSDVAQQLEHSKISKLRKDVAAVEAEIARLETLLKQADPDGYFREGTHAARLAREKGLRLFNQDKEKKAALEKKKRHEAAQKAAKEAAAKLFVPETEEEEAAGNAEESTTTPHAPAENVHRLEAAEDQFGGLRILKAADEEKKTPPSVGFAPSQPPIAPKAESGGSLSVLAKEGEPPNSKQQRDAMIRAALAAEKAASAQAEAPAAGQDALLADLALLKRAGKAETLPEEGPRKKKGKAANKEAGWQPPTGQSGDGRTSLNEKLGY